MKHFQLPESNKSMILLAECVFLSAAMPGLVYTIIWIILFLLQGYFSQRMNSFYMR